jgi:hypothetical protein
MPFENMSSHILLGIVGVMALDTFATPSVPSVLDAEKVAACTIRILEKCVATQAQVPGGIERERLNAVGMVDARAMTIFALHRGVRRSVEHVNVFLMAFDAGLSTLVLHGKVLPLLDVTQAMKTVGEIPAVNAEVIRNQKYPGDEDCSDQSDCYPQRAQDVPLHLQPPRYSRGIQKTFNYQAGRRKFTKQLSVLLFLSHPIL